MDNLIINKITLDGPINDIKLVYQTYTQVYPYNIIMNDEGLLVFSKIENEEVVVGFLNPETNIFIMEEHDEIVGIPEGFKILTSPTFARFPDFTLIKPIPLELLNSDLDPSILEGVIHNWCIENWGVRENVQDFDFLTHKCVEFTTLWKGVPKLIEEISKSFPELIIHYEYADMENLGINCGKYTFINGELEKQIFEDGSKEAYEMIFNFIPEFREDYELVNGNYVFIDME